MKSAIQFGYILSFALIRIGMGTSFASCPDKIEQRLCDQLKQSEDTAWIGCLIELTTLPLDSEVTDPTKDTTAQHDTSTHSPAPYLVAEVETLFTTYELRWPDTISQYRLAPYPKGTRASIPSQIEKNYGLFARKRDVLSIGTKDYILKVWAWLPDGPASLSPLMRKDLQSRHQGDFFNLNGRRMDGLKFRSGQILNLKQ